MRVRSKLLAGITVSAFALAWHSPTWAQESSASEENTTEESPNVIIVTGLKRSQNAQDVPKAVEVVSQEELTTAGVSSIQDLGRVSPAIQGQGALSSAPSIRGVGSFSFAIGVQSQTGVVLDDVPQPSFSTLTDDLTDVTRVEVFAGPQSTLSGRNAAGGLINIVTQNPTADWSGAYRFEQTSDSQTRASGFVAGPISDTFGFSVSSYYNQWDGHLANLQEAGRPINQFERWGVRGKLRWELTPNLEATLTGFYTRADVSTNAILGGGPFVEADTALQPTLLVRHPGITIEPFSRDVSVPGHGTGLYENKGGVLRIDYETGLGTFSSISSYSKSNQDRDDLTLGYPVFGFVIRQQTDIAVDYKTQEFRLVSPTSGSPFEYLIGAIYTDTDTFQPFERAILFPAQFDRSSLVRSVAVYGRGTYDLTPTTAITLGARYQHDYMEYQWLFTDGTSPTSEGSNKYDFVTGEASLEQELMPDLKIYATYANGETGQVYDTEDVQSARSPDGLQPLDSQRYEHFEAGLKSQLLDRRLTFNLAAFRTTYKNYQFQAADLSDPSQAAIIRLLTIGKVRTQGVDVEANFSVSSNFSLGVSAEYLDGEILDYPGANCFPGQTVEQGCVGGQQNARGPLPGTSKFRAVAFADLTIPTPSLPFDLTLGTFARYQSSALTNVEGDERTRRPGYAIVNITAGIEDRDGRYSAELFVNNVGDKNFYSGLGVDALSLPSIGIIGAYARDSFRYWGGRFSLNF